MKRGDLLRVIDLNAVTVKSRAERYAKAMQGL
jgi:hypothetical protein